MQLTNKIDQSAIAIFRSIWSPFYVSNIHPRVFFPFFVANTSQIQPFHKGLAIQADVPFVLCQKQNTDINYQCGSCSSW
jgi:hypothetical protein